MRRLMLLRHAKTETDAPSGQDQDRRLDNRGRSDAAEIGSWIATHPPFPDLVLVSPAVRAHQTWDIAWEAMKDRVPQPAVEFLPELYGAEPAQLLQAVRMAASTDPKRLMLAGSGDKAAKKAIDDNLPTSGLAVLDFEIDDWSDVAFRRGRLVLFVSPKLLRQTSDD